MPLLYHSMPCPAPPQDLKMRVASLLSHSVGVQYTVLDGPDALTEYRHQVCILLGRPLADAAAMEVIEHLPQPGDPMPPAACTTMQLGISDASPRGVPGLLDAMAPRGKVPAQAMEYLRRLLLLPPPPATAEAVQFITR